jgi:hypothetical protein
MVKSITTAEQYKNEPEMEYLPKRVKRGMEFLLKTSSKLFNDKKLKPNHEYMPFLIKVIQELKRQGVGILLGTDKGTPYVVAGFSLLKELKLLNMAGLTPFEAIQAGTNYVFPYLTGSIEKQYTKKSRVHFCF